MGPGVGTVGDLAVGPLDAESGTTAAINVNCREQTPTGFVRVRVLVLAPA